MSHTRLTGQGARNKTKLFSAVTISLYTIYTSMRVYLSMCAESIAEYCYVHVLLNSQLTMRREDMVT